MESRLIFVHWVQYRLQREKREQLIKIDSIADDDFYWFPLRILIVHVKTETSRRLRRRMTFMLMDLQGKTNRFRLSINDESRCVWFLSADNGAIFSVSQEIFGEKFT